ncbi:MAG: DUF1446 domain-containing protein [Defluviitaleaceae bacterium]|nr:DUF1446 domain-containing protein [Defluviitaleaceae bacterium]
MKEMRILSPTAILGYGFPESSFEAGMAQKPHIIAVDAGSTDPGPYYLGSGNCFVDRAGTKRDLTFMLKAAIKENIPLIIGTAGGSGARDHLQRDVEIIKEIAKENNLSFKIAVIPSDINKNTVLEALKKGNIAPLYPAPMPTEEEILNSTNIVAQMGAEPILAALNQNINIIITGRAYDPVVFSALAIKDGFDTGLALHLGKILECAAIAATPGSGSDCMLGILREDHFELKALNEERKCTTTSVAAHTLYEKSDPAKLHGPGGILDLTETTFEQNTEETVIVRGTKFIKGEYYIKLEAARKLGMRTVSFAATADHIMIKEIPTILQSIREKIKANFTDLKKEDYFIDFKIYGTSGVSLFGLQSAEPPTVGQNFSDYKFTSANNSDVSINKFNLAEPPAVGGGEAAIIIDVVANTKELSKALCSFARSTMLHFGYAGRISTAGNLAFPFSPSDFDGGEVYEFSVYALLKADPLEHFPLEVLEL